MKHFQSVTRIHVGRYIATIYRNELHLNATAEPERRDLEMCADEIRKGMNLKPQPPNLIANLFLNMPRVDSVEVLDVAGNGVRLCK